jgi:membrane associated rhomboid family serine protease
VGVADRFKDWDQPPPQGGVRFSAPRLAGAVKTLMAANAIVFMLKWLGTLGASDVEAARHWVNSTFGLFPGEWDSLLFPIWQPVSYGFVHGGLGHLFWNMIQLYFFGSMLEAMLGRRRFFVAYFGGMLCGALFHCVAFAFGGVADFPTVGASGAVIGVVVAVAVLRPNQTVMFFFFPLSLKYLALGLVFFDVYGVIEGGGGTAHWVHLGGACFGGFGAWKGLLMRDPLALLSARSAIRAEEKRSADVELVDSLLEKISSEGISSLTEREKVALKRASQRRKV